ncbi:MAG: alpha/beta fold hydrolase [Fulvivirga sp.]|nr:alpha/beta fold hydrolase [Fulvivirga sp.]
MPLLKSDYKPPVFLRNGHLATIMPSLFRKIEGVEYERERIYTPDEDFLDLDWVRTKGDKLVIISHGLEGSSDRWYMKGMVKYFTDHQWDALAWNCRSCSGELNWKPRFYHHGATEDLDQVIHYAISKHKYKHVALVGFSMGGSMTLKYLGEKGEQVPEGIIGGAAFSVPVSLKSSVDALASRNKSFYRNRFLKKLEAKIKQKALKHPEIEYEGFEQIKYFPDFDNLYTAPLHGFKDAEDFYQRASASRYMYDTRTPVLVVNALNDPFLGAACYPYEKCENHAFIHLETPKHGGHVGFSLAGSKYSYMEKRALRFFKDQIELQNPP